MVVSVKAAAGRRDRRRCRLRRRRRRSCCCCCCCFEKGKNRFSVHGIAGLDDETPALAGGGILGRRHRFIVTGFAVRHGVSAPGADAAETAAEGAAEAAPAPGGDVQKGRSEVDALDDLPGDGSLRNPRSPDQEGHQDVRLVGLAFSGRDAVVTKVLAVVLRFGSVRFGLDHRGFGNFGGCKGVSERVSE